MGRSIMGTARQTTFWLHGPEPYEQVVKTLNRRQCKRVLEDLRYDEKVVSEKAVNNWDKWATSAGMTGDEMRDRKLEEICGNIALTEARLAELGGGRTAGSDLPIVRAEVVKSHEDMATGLMGRKHLPRNAGMLFDFGQDKPLSFWMANTYIPLQIAFISSAGVVKQIERMVPMSTRSIRSSGECRYALEVNDGWFDENMVRVGATVAVPGDGGGNQAQDSQQQENAAPPDVAIEQSFKDILRAVNDYGVAVVVEYITKDGLPLPPKQISPPIEFGDTAEGDVNGLATVWDDQRSRYTSLIIDDIVGIKDTKGNPIVNVDGVKAVAAGTPAKVQDEVSSKGKVPGLAGNQQGG
jgi:uncharacterized protein